MLSPLSWRTWRSIGGVNTMSAFKQRAFTMMELIAVTIIVTLVAGFAIPQYQRSVERAHAREAITNLIMIHAANHAFRLENGVFWPGTTALVLSLDDPNGINEALNLNILANGVLYRCANIGDPAVEFDCLADRDPSSSSFRIWLTEAPIDIDADPNVNPSCNLSVNGSCPY